MESWQVCSLEEVVKFIDYRGKTPKKTEDGMRLITAKNVKMGYLQSEPMEFVDPEIYDRWMTRGIPKEGDVLFTTEAPLGNVTQLDTDEKVVFAQRIIVMQPNREMLDSTFLKYMLLSNLMQERIRAKGTGATVQGIKSQLLKKILISFPRSLLEQKRIVSIVDQAFEGIDRAIAHTKKNRTNARELFESYLNAIFIQKGDRLENLKSKFVPLSTLLSEQPRNGWSPPAIFQTGEGTPVLTLSAVTGFDYDGSRVKLTSAPTKEEAHYWLKEGELLMTRSNTRELVGHVAIYNGNPQRAICCDLIMKMTVDYTKADTRFVYYYLRSLAARKYLTGRATGASATMPKINKQVVQEAPIPSFSLAKQQDIVRKLDAIAVESQRLEAIYKQKLTTLTELKQSILQKAFTGELTADTANQTTKNAEEAIAA